MYDLVQAGLLWSKKFGMALDGKVFERSQAYPCVFRRDLHRKVVVIIVAYVDDLIVASATKSDEEQALRDIYFCFSVKDLGKASKFTGCYITRDRNAGRLKFDQHQYVEAVAGGKALSKVESPQTDTKADEMRQVPYQEAVGALVWAATMTWSDLSKAAHQLAKVNDNLEPVHSKGTSKELQHVWRTKNMRNTPGGKNRR